MSDLLIHLFDTIQLAMCYQRAKSDKPTFNSGLNHRLLIRTFGEVFFLSEKHKISFAINFHQIGVRASGNQCKKPLLGRTLSPINISLIRYKVTKCWNVFLFLSTNVKCMCIRHAQFTIMESFLRCAFFQDETDQEDKKSWDYSKMGLKQEQRSNLVLSNQSSQ